jgi:glycosyltransferase involved in cell wall biosynthesis
MNPPVAAAIVPAHNEAQRIGAVIGALVASGAFREVIVVSDGSTDDTVGVARAAGATLVHALPRNRGKGAAMSHGVMHTDAPVIAFFDADLVGFTEEHARQVLAPVLGGRAYMHVGMRDRGPLVNALQPFLPLVSGERAMRREVFDAVSTKYLQGFMAELALNYFCRVNRLPVTREVLRGSGIVTKFGKLGVLAALPKYAAMWAQTARAAVLLRLARRRFVERGTHMSHRHF